MTVSSLTLIYSSNFTCERLFLFDKSNLRQNYWVRAVTALLCLRSYATRKIANDMCFSYSAEETLPWSISFVFRSRYSTVLSCYTHQLFLFTSKQIRRGSKKVKLCFLSLPVSQRKTEPIWEPPWSTGGTYFRKNSLSGPDNKIELLIFLFSRLNPPVHWMVQMNWVGSSKDDEMVLVVLNRYWTVATFLLLTD